MNSREVQKRVGRELELLGVQDFDLEKTKRHYKYTLRFGGKQGCVVVSSTISDNNRGWLQIRGDIRRTVRGLAA